MTLNSRFPLFTSHLHLSSRQVLPSVDASHLRQNCPRDQTTNILLSNINLIFTISFFFKGDILFYE